MLYLAFLTRDCLWAFPESPHLGSQPWANSPVSISSSHHFSFWKGNLSCHYGIGAMITLSFWAKWEHRVCPADSSRAILKDFRCASVVCLLLWPGVGRKRGPSLAPWQVFEGGQKRSVISTARPRQGTRKSTKRIFSSTPRISNRISWWVHWVSPHLASKDGLKMWWTQCLSSGTLIAGGGVPRIPVGSPFQMASTEG